MVESDLEAVARRGADLVLEAARRAFADRGSFSLVLAGGSTPRRLYRGLAKAPVDWDRVQFFYGGTHLSAREALLDHVPIADGSIHRIRGEEGPVRAASLYEDEIAGWSRFDLVLLGMGGDGHTASLFPGGPELDETERRVVSSRSPAPPTDRVTLSLPAINSAREVLFVVTGEAKARRVAEVLGGADLPAARVRPAEGRVVWLLDRAAAGLLSEGG
jgi:6-phosphogluconolactonase